MRVLLFTDTLGDINGVSRFIRNVAAIAHETGRSLTVFCSTRFTVPRQPNIINFPPRFAPTMPGYENLELAIPPALSMLAAARRLRPDTVHISTPGPVGAVGWLAAAMLRVPRIGVYHTDFPAYIDRLFDNDSLTWMCEGLMSRFYRPFARVLTRSTDYHARLRALGIDGAKLAALKPGIRLEEFERPSPRSATTGGARPVRVLYVGRLSIEKNLGLLTRIWIDASARLRELGTPAELILVGDGPDRTAMQRELEAAGAPALFLGFLHGSALVAEYHGADLFVFPSVTDTLGQVVLEAQAAALPVLVSDIGGPKEVVRDGETGFVLPHNRPGDWTDRLVALATDDGRRAAMSAAAAAHAAGFSITDSFEHYWSLHESVVRAPAGRTRAVASDSSAAHRYPAA